MHPLGPPLRSHWAIENSLHNIMDTVLRDDEYRVKTNQAAQTSTPSNTLRITCPNGPPASILSVYAVRSPNETANSQRALSPYNLLYASLTRCAWGLLR